MQDGYPDYDNRHHDYEKLGDVQEDESLDFLFWVIVIFMAMLLIGAGFYGGQMSCVG